MSPQIYNWQSMLPVVLEVAADGKAHHRTDYKEAVRRITARDFGDEIHRKLKHGYSYEDRANWATFELRRSGLLADVERAVTQITPEGIQWLKDNPYPLSREQQRAFVKMRDRVLEAKGTIEKTSSDDDADEPETSDDYVWVLRAGKDGVREKRALQENLGLPGLYYNEEVENAETLDEIKKAMRAAHPEWKRGQINTQAGQLYRFRTKLQVGDIVLMPSNHVNGAVYHGTVTGPVTIDRSEPDVEAHLRVPIEWSDEPFRRDELGIDLRRSITSLLTISQVKRNNAHERFLSVIDGSGDPDFNVQDFPQRSRSRSTGLTSIANSQSDLCLIVIIAQHCWIHFVRLHRYRSAHRCSICCGNGQLKTVKRRPRISIRSRSMPSSTAH